MLSDVTTRAAVAADRIEALRDDFRRPGGAIRLRVGRRLIRIGAWLADEEPRRAKRQAPRPSQALF